MRAIAAVKRETDPGSYSIEEVELGDLRPDEVLVRIVGAGHCHTDVIAATGFGLSMPFVFGHEGAGVVEAIGDAVSEVSVGDHVVLSFAYCGRCDACRSGHPSSCDEFQTLNASGGRSDGTSPITDLAGNRVNACWFGQSSFASYAIAGLTSIVRVDDDLPLETLAPLGCGIQTGAGTVLNILQPSTGSSIAVYGVGAVGLAAVMAAKLAGASTIVAVDLNERRLELATRCGATHTVRSDERLAESMLEVTAGGVELAVDTTAVPTVLKAAIRSLRPGGRLATVGIGEGLQDHSLLTDGKTMSQVVEGDVVPQVFIPQLIEHWRAGRFPFDELITTFPLADIGAAESAALAGVVVKPVLVP